MQYQPLDPITCPHIKGKCDDTTEHTCPLEICLEMKPVIFGVILVDDLSRVDFWDLLHRFGAGKSKSEAGRLVKQEAIKHHNGEEWEKFTPEDRYLDASTLSGKAFRFGKLKTTFRAYIFKNTEGCPS